MFTPAELAELFDTDMKTSVSIEGVAVAIIPGNFSTGRSDYDGDIRTTWDFTLAASTYPGELLPDMELDIDGLRWTVDQVGRASQDLIDLTVSRKAI